MKFPNLYPFVLARYIEFALAFSISLTPFHNHTLSLYKSKGSITPKKSCFYSTMALLCPWPYYSSPRIYISFFTIDRFTSMTMWHSSKSTFILTDAWLRVVKSFLTRHHFLAPFDHLFQCLCFLQAIPPGWWNNIYNSHVWPPPSCCRARVDFVLLCILGRNVRSFGFVLRLVKLPQVNMSFGAIQLSIRFDHTYVWSSPPHETRWYLHLESPSMVHNPHKLTIKAFIWCKIRYMYERLTSASTMVYTHWIHNPSCCRVAHWSEAPNGSRSYLCIIESLTWLLPYVPHCLELFHHDPLHHVAS